MYVLFTKIGRIQRRLAWPLRKDDTQIREAFHIFSTLDLFSNLFHPIIIIGHTNVCLRVSQRSFHVYRSTHTHTHTHTHVCMYIYILLLLLCVCVSWSWINPIWSAMWSAAWFCSGTSSIYSVYTPFLVPLFVSLVFHIISLQKLSVPSDFPVLACCLKDCIEDVTEWMGDSKLKMNDDETELMAIGTRLKLNQVIPTLAPMFIPGCDISFSQSLRNLGFYLD